MDSPIRGQVRELTRKVEATVPMNIHNRFDIEVIDARTHEVRQRAQAENTICSQLWTRLFAPNAYFNYIHYGTGSGTPASTDTRLFTFLGYGVASNQVITRNLAACTYSSRKSITLSETTAVGATLTEVGIGYDTSSTSLCTHAMLKDMNGNQISIAKTNTDIINIYATVFVHWSPDLYNGNILVNPLAATIDLFAGGEPYLPNYIAYRHGRCHNSYSSHMSSSLTRDAVNKMFTIRYTRLGASSGNEAGGHEYALLYAKTSGVYYPYDTLLMLKAGAGWYPGTDIVGEAIGTGDGTTVDFSTDFDFPTNAKVYVNGVEDASVIVDNKPIAPCVNTGFQQYFESILVENGIAYPGLVNGDMSFSGLTPGIYYNPLYEYGLKQISLYRDPTTLYASNDLVTWTQVLTYGYTDIPIAYQYYKYWKVEGATNTFAYYGKPVSTSLNGKNIHFSTPPASGAVITADYHTPTIAKDANHVFDLTVTIQLGEYTE